MQLRALGVPAKHGLTVQVTVETGGSHQMHCVSCGLENRAQARFCDACGKTLPVAGTEMSPDLGRSADRAAPRSYTPQHLVDKILTSRSALEGERKQVTVLFCDLANSTELARRLGAEAMHETLNAFFEMAMAEVHDVEGTLNQFLGDGFMALFGAPLAHEDHVQRALHSALRIAQRLREAAASGSALLSAVRVRMGVNTGPVVVGRIGDNLRMDYTAIGDTTNVAARLQASAEPGGICVSEAVQAIGLAHFEFADRGSKQLKGITEPVRVYGLVRERSRDETDAQRGGIGSPMVGRDAELASVQTALAGLPSGRGGIVIVQGDPGAGKSRLLAEVRRRWDDSGRAAANHPGLWLEGRSLSFGRNLSYWPFIEMLKRGFGIRDDDSELLALGKLERGLEPVFAERTTEVLPYLAAMLALPVRPEHEDRLKYLDGPGLKRQVFLCMRQFAELMTRRQPVVLMMEDWHWADQSSVELAEHLLPLTLTAPLVMIFPTRSQGDGTRDLPIERVRQFVAAQPGATLTDVALAPLSAAQSAVLVANLVGRLKLPLSLSEQIQRKTEGNPFFIEEVIRALVSDGVLVPAPRGEGWQLTRAVDQIQLPDTLQGLILSRIDRLDEDAKQALKLASVIGRSFIDRVLVAISEERGQLHQCLAELQQAELIREKQRLPELEYIFKHALVQEAAYGSILAESRRGIHRRVAQTIETLFADRLDEFASLLAHHYTCAEDWDKAQEFLFKAGDQAGRMAADAEALENLRHAEAAYLKVYGNRLQPLQRAQLARKIGAALYGTGHYEQAHAQMREALAHLDLAYPKGRWGVRGAVLRQLAAHFVRRCRTHLGLHPARVIDEAVAAEVSTIVHFMAWMDYFLDKERMLLDSLLELHVGELSHHALAEARGLSSLGFGLMTFNLRTLARGYHNHAVAVAQRSANPSAIAFAWLALGFLDFYDGQWDHCEARFGKAEAAYRDSGDIHRWASAALMLSFVLHQRGDLTRAVSLTQEIVRAGDDAADPQVASWGLQNLGAAMTAAGPLPQAESELRRGQAIAERIGAWDNLLYLKSLLSKCLLAQGKLDAALAELLDAERVMLERGLRLPYDRIEVLTAAAAVRVAVAERSVSDAPGRLFRDAARACTAALRCARQMPLWLPLALRLHGTLSWLQGDKHSAQGHWRESLDVAEKSAFPVERALTLHEQGRRLGDAGLCEQAVSVLRQAGAHGHLASLPTLHSMPVEPPLSIQA
jgi:class 3 adenylate cyclase/tetratricopeptide (TPR) repeat protein